MNTSTPIRFAIWAAVSTTEQAADDKYSLAEQESSCRAAGLSRGWMESAGMYIVAGESRTRWVNLSDAQEAIPPLKTMLDDAQAGKFDVLICKEYDRFRELLDPVARTLNHYGAQLFSVAQPIEPQTPDDYDPYGNDSEFMLRGMNQIISRAAIANLHRKYATQMPRRILERGLPAIIPWGYRKPMSGGGTGAERSAVPVQDPDVIPHIILIKDMFLAGRSTSEIADEMEARCIPNPGSRVGRTAKQWHDTTIKRILSNPFYTGYVRWGVSKTRLDPRTGKTSRKYSKAGSILARGRHIPVWDDDTRAQIDAELARRKHPYRGRITRALSNLLYCPVCGALLWHATRAPADGNSQRRDIWSCSKGGAPHITLDDRLALESLAREIINVLRETEEIPAPENYQKQIDELKIKRGRIGDAYASGLFDLSEFSRRAGEVDDQIKTLETQSRQNGDVVNKTNLRNQIVVRLRSHGDVIEEYLTQGDAQEVNRVLSMLFVSVVMDGGGRIISLTPK